MKPGRDLDILVAEKVMGWTSCKDSPWWYMEIRPEVPAYSGSIIDAWEIAEKLHMTVHTPNAPYACGEYANGGNWENEEEKYKAECCRHGAPEWSDTVVAHGLTAPHAICMTALKAMGIGGKEE